MKKIYLTILGFVFAIVSSIAILGFKNNQTARAEENLLSRPEFFTITQDGKVFSEADFIPYTFKETTYKAIFTNKTITLNLVKTGYVLDGFSVSTTSFDGDNVIELGISPTTQVTDNNGKVTSRYVFDVTALSEDTQQLIYVSYRSQGTVYSFKFMLIQTKTDIITDPNMYWTYNLNYQAKVKAPTNNVVYPPISLYLPNTGTALNPIYVRFSYLGEMFTVYKIGNNFYNAFDNSSLDIDYLLFDQSGQYTVEIYDKTAEYLILNTETQTENTEKIEHSNYFIYNFSVKNITDVRSSFYIHAHNYDGELIANNQVSNSDVLVDFVNIEDLKYAQIIDSIVVTKSWKPSTNEILSEQTVYSDNIPSSLLIDQDGSYNITAYDKDGEEIKMYEFIIIKTIRNYFEMNGEVYRIGPDEPDNTYRTKTFNSSIESSYNNIYGQTNYSFNVTIAKSNPGISGIGNNGTKAGNLTLTIFGVGKINVEVTFEGNETKSYVVQNGQKLEKLTEPGEYLVKITDEMGTTITKTFTLTVKRNTAAKIIIIVGICLAVTLVVVIVLKRSKVKVR